jgi:plasmid stabilization system protein ParE
MTKPWRLTKAAQDSLVDIALWTIETFGPRQAEAYEEDIIACCENIASGKSQSQSCRLLIDPDLPEDLRFARVGQHFVVFIDTPDQVIILEFLHSRSNLPRHLAGLTR